MTCGNCKNYLKETSECIYLYAQYRKAGKPLGENINGVIVKPFINVDDHCPGYKHT
jgi:hypothetical protein